MTIALTGSITPSAKGGSIVFLASQLPADKALLFVELYSVSKKDRIQIWVLSVFFGMLGVDRFFLGNLNAGVLKLITLGGCGIWYVIDLLIIDGATRERNKEIAYRIYSQLSDQA